MPGARPIRVPTKKRPADAVQNPLLTSFGVSLVERAVMDALARQAGLSFARAVRTNLYQIRPGEIHEELEGLQPADWLPPEPAQSIFVRHTIGFGDPITNADIPAGEQLNDGFPQSLEEYIVQSGVRRFKLKISPDVNHTRYRILRVAELCQKHLGADYLVTLDANELFQSVQQLEELVAALRATPQLGVFVKNILAVEQPLARHVALAPHHADAIRRLSDWRPVIIDESDATLDGYARAKQVRLSRRHEQELQGAGKKPLERRPYLAGEPPRSDLRLSHDRRGSGLPWRGADASRLGPRGHARNGARRAQCASLLPGAELSARSRTLRPLWPPTATCTTNSMAASPRGSPRAA